MSKMALAVENYDLTLGRISGEVQGVLTPPPLLPEMTCCFLIQLVFCTKICLRHHSVTPFLGGVDPLLRKILDPPLLHVVQGTWIHKGRGILRAVQGGGDGLTFTLAENLHYANLDKLKRQDYCLLVVICKFS